MWSTKSRGKRRAVNRRHSRHAKRQAEWHQLDVKMRPRRGKRPLRRHRSVWGLRIAAITVSLISLSAAGRWIYRNSVVENTEFKLQQVVVLSDGALSPQHLAEASGAEPGANLMTLDLDAIRESVEALPLVESATVERVFPADLEIRVTERKPVAWLACQPADVLPYVADGGFLLSDEGLVLTCDRLLPQFERLPVIEVLEMPDSKSNSGPDPKQMAVALELLQKSGQHFGHTGLELLEIKLYSAYSLICVYNQQIEVVFGLTEIDRQLQDFAWILDDAVAAGRRLATINTMMSRNIPVTFHDAVLPTPHGPSAPNLRPLNSGGGGSDSATSTNSDLRQILRRG